MWYRLTFVTTNSTATRVPGRRTILHFGAVDWQSAFFVNGKHIANHTGGYDAINLDISDALKQNSSELNELVVYVFDPSNLGEQPNGKQNIGRPTDAGGGQYTPSSGIWQTVWLEVVPVVYIGNLSLSQNSKDTLAISAAVEGAADGIDGISNHTLVFNVYEIGSTKVIATGTAAPGSVVSLKIPSPRLWGPNDPNLYDIKVTLLSSSSATIAAAPVDEVVGYFGLRSFRLGKQQPANVTRPLLNGQFTFLAGWLDQSWWPDGQYAAPTDEALSSDVQAVPMFGLNMIRLHMKVNPERWYYHADTVGVVVFQDMVQKICVNKCTKQMLEYYVADLKAMINGRKNHPCIVQFTLLNEEDMWQLFETQPWDLPGLLEFARTLAPDHLIDMNSGGNGAFGKSAARARLGDVVDVHTYPSPNVKPNTTDTQYAMLGEFGGVGAFVAGKEWRPPTPKQKSCFAYNLPLHPLATPTDEAHAYIQMADLLLSWSDQLSASVYTQITDVELECDGFLNYDRTNKFDDMSTAAIKAANRRLTRPGGPGSR
jgi:beta-galactosidase/beta-glucuronidase